jgi:Tfp pilus assembly protein PilF
MVSAHHLYARECGANTWYAIGAVRLRQGDDVEAAAAFARAVGLVPRHPMARLGLALLSRDTGSAANDVTVGPRGSLVDAVLGAAVGHVRRGAPGDAASLLETALAAAPPGNAAWLLPLEPLLNVAAAPEVWAAALACVRLRAA